MQKGSELVPTAALRAKLKRGEPCLGCWLTIADPFAVEALAQQDLKVDWAQVEMEHQGLAWKDLQNILFGWRRSSIPLLVRVPSHDTTYIGRVLDLGAAGVVVPFVNTPEEAARVAAACRYPPQGTRGFAPRSASRHFTEVEAYLEVANEAIFVMVQIEHVRSVENVRAIAQAAGVDALFIGPADLSFSMGIPLQWEHPGLLSAIRQVIAVGRDYDKPVAMAVDGSPPEVVRWLREGLMMATIGVDWSFIRQGINQTAMGISELLREERQ